MKLINIVIFLFYGREVFKGIFKSDINSNIIDIDMSALLNTQEESLLKEKDN